MQRRSGVESLSQKYPYRHPVIGVYRFMKIGQLKLSERKSEAPRPQGAASRRGSFLHIVPLDPTYKAGLAGHVPAKEVGCLFYLLLFILKN
jgi:hypothetical protein